MDQMGFASPEQTKKKHESSSAANASGEVNRIDPDEVVAGCFEFRLRTRSFDLHQLAHGHKLKKFGRLFRANSETGEKHSSSVPSSPAGGASPRHSPPRRRRFVRVVRDRPEDCSEDGRYVVHRYSEAYLEHMYQQRFDSEGEPGDRPLPYEVTGHTILKRPMLQHTTSMNSNSSCGGDGETTPTVFKHASFRDEVVVIEYDKKGNVHETQAKHIVPLHDAIIDDFDSHAACQRFEDFALTEAIAAFSKHLVVSDDSGTCGSTDPTLNVASEAAAESSTS